MTSKYYSVNNLKVSEELLHFVNNELLDGTDISPEKFWINFDKAVHELAPKNKKLIDLEKHCKKKLIHGIRITKEKIFSSKNTKNF